VRRDPFPIAFFLCFFVLIDAFLFFRLSAPLVGTDLLSLRKPNHLAVAIPPFSVNPPWTEGCPLLYFFFLLLISRFATVAATLVCPEVNFHPPLDFPENWAAVFFSGSPGARLFYWSGMVLHTPPPLFLSLSFRQVMVPTFPLRASPLFFASHRPLRGQGIFSGVNQLVNNEGVFSASQISFFFFFSSGFF